MKKLLTLLVASLFIISCNKTSLNEPELAQRESSGTDLSLIQKGGGVLPDPPELKKNFGMKVSREFIEHGRTVAFNKFGKKIVDMRADDAEMLMRGTAARGSSTNKGGTKGGGWGQGGNPGSGGTGGSTGGSTGGGGTVTPTGDITPPRVVGVEPANGQIYNLSGQYIRVTLFAWIDDGYEDHLARIQVTVRGDIVLDSTGPFKRGYGNWNTIQKDYYFPYGDGTYDMTWKAWDSAGNVTIRSSVFTRNTDFTTIPSNMPSSYILPHPVNENTGRYIYQGGEGACAAFAVNSAFTIQRYVHRGLTGGFNDDNVYSPEWIYNIAVRGQGCGVGSGVVSNMGTVVGRGVPTWRYLPFDYNNGCDTSIFTDAMRANAALNKGVWGFSTPTADINAIKYNIYRGYVGAFGYNLASDMVSSGPGFIWNFPHRYDMANHASCIIGYDDSKHAFLMLNSWGPTWADQGTVWIDYDFMWQAVSGALWYFGD